MRRRGHRFYRQPRASVAAHSRRLHAYLGRSPDPAGLAYWVRQLGSGVTNEDVITGFVASDEYFAVQTA